MSRKRKTIENDPTEEIVKKVKTILLNTIIREWLNTRVEEWNNLTPLELIRKGEGQQMLDAITQSEQELKTVRVSKKENQNAKRSRKTEKTLEQEILHP